MRMWLMAAVCAAALLPAPMTMAGSDPATLASQRMGPWGYDRAGQDDTTTAKTDFFRWANGGWIDKTEIPADRSRWGMFSVLAALSETRVRDIIEGSAQAASPSGDQALIGTLYNSFMDEAAIEARGATPIAPQLAAIRAADDRQALAGLTARAYVDYYPTLFGGYVSPDAGDPSTYVFWMGQGGIGLPDRDYYLEQSFADEKAAYQVYVAKALELAGWADPAANAAAVVEFETGLARAHWTQVENRDDVKTYNHRTAGQLSTEAPGFAWDSFLDDVGVADRPFLIAQQPSAFTGMAKVWADTPVPVLQAWMAFHTVNNAAPYLSSPFVQANFDFFSKTLSGQPQMRERWKRGVTLVNGQIPHAVGRIYADRYYTPESRAQMADLIANMRGAMQARIEGLDWMSESTKAQAQTKLTKFEANIGAPDKYRDYGMLRLAGDDVVGNVQRANAMDWTYYLSRLDQPVERNEWTDTPQTVNAWYRSTRNDISFPAGILEPPFFDPGADPAINYGAIGGVIGHEIIHGFDDQGRKSDGDGVLRDWWTGEDARLFQVQADRLGAQYEAIPMFPDAHINGELTMGENLADLGGLTMALDAYRLSLDGKPSPVIDGLTGDQRVFLGWAQAWRSKDREALARQLLVSDPHAPSIARVNGVVRNIDGFYEAFDVQPGDPMYLPPENRVRLW